MTKSQARQEKAVAAARINSMRQELDFHEATAIPLEREIVKIRQRIALLKNSIEAEKFSVKDL